MELDSCMLLLRDGFVTGLKFANISILSGWGIKQLIIFFKKLIY